MHCVKCQTHVASCKCADLLERLAAAQRDSNGTLNVERTINRVILLRDAERRVN